MFIMSIKRLAGYGVRFRLIKLRHKQGENVDAWPTILLDEIKFQHIKILNRNK